MLTILNPPYPAPQSPLEPRDPREAITDAVVHHSAGSPTQTPLEIDAEERHTPPPNGPYSMMPYNRLIGLDGSVFAGRPLEYNEAATYGRHAESLSICVIGQFQPNAPNFAPPTPAQVVSLKMLLVDLHREFPGIIRTIAHRDVAPMFYPHDQGDYATACCGQVLYDMLPSIRAYIRSQMAR